MAKDIITWGIGPTDAGIKFFITLGLTPDTFVAQIYTANVYVNISPAANVDVNISPTGNIYVNPSPTANVEVG